MARLRTKKGFDKEPLSRLPRQSAAVIRDGNCNVRTGPSVTEQFVAVALGQIVGEGSDGDLATSRERLARVVQGLTDDLAKFLSVRRHSRQPVGQRGMNLYCHTRLLPEHLRLLGY